MIVKAYLAIFQHEGLFSLVDAVHLNLSWGHEYVVDEKDKHLIDRFNGSL